MKGTKERRNEKKLCTDFDDMIVRREKRECFFEKVAPSFLSCDRVTLKWTYLWITVLLYRSATVLRRLLVFFFLFYWNLLLSFSNFCPNFIQSYAFFRQIMNLGYFISSANIAREYRLNTIYDNMRKRIVHPSLAKAILWTNQLTLRFPLVLFNTCRYFYFQW